MNSKDFFSKILKAKESEKEKQVVINELQKEIGGEVPQDLKNELDILCLASPKGSPKDFSENFSKKYPKANFEVYRQLLPYAKLICAFEKKGVPDEYARKLSMIFDKVEDALFYLKVSDANTINNACSFAIPTDDVNWKIWKRLAQRFLKIKEFRESIFPKKNQIEKRLIEKSKLFTELKTLGKNKKRNQEGLKNVSTFTTTKKIENDILRSVKAIQEMNSECKSKGKKDKKKITQKDREEYEALLVKLHEKKIALAESNLKFDGDLSWEVLSSVNEKLITEASQAYEYFLDHGLKKKDYLKFIDLNRENAGKKIPDILIKGEELSPKYPNFYLMKVSVADEKHAARAACLGKLTNCCQCLSAMGEPCVVHGLTSENGGFYVVCKGDIKNIANVNDEVVGQSWVWRSKHGALVFDSIETSKKDDHKQTEILKSFFLAAAKKMVEEGYTNKVACGSNSGISEEVGLMPFMNKREEFKDYAGYTDASSQLILFDKEKLFYWYGVDPDSTEKTNAMILSKNNTLKSEDSLVKSTDLMMVLNWAILQKKQDLVKKIEEIFKKNPIIKLGQGVKIGKKPLERIGLPRSIIKKEQILAPIQINKRLLEFNKIKETLTDFIYLKDMTDLRSFMENEYFPSHAVNSEGNGLFLLAISNSNEELAIDLINKGTKINIVNNNGDTPLTLAASKGCSRVVSELINKAANINVVNNDGDTPLTLAISEGKTEIALALIEKNADIKFENKKGETPLMLAFLGGHEDIVAKLIEKGANVNDVNNNGDTALMMAILKDKREIIGELIKKYKVNINAVNNDGYTALNLAFNQDFLMADILIQEGAEVNGTNESNEETPLTLAITSNFANAFSEYLIKKGAKIYDKNKKGETALMRLIDVKDLEKNLLARNLFKKLIEAKEKPEDLDLANNKGETALMLAISKGNKDAAIELINKGVNVKLENKKGETALTLAIARNYDWIESEIKKRGGSIDDKNKEGETPLMSAISKGNTDFALKLIARNAKLDLRDKKNKTALALAISEGETKVALAIIQRMNKARLDSEGALMLAIAEDNTEVALALIENGVNIDLPNEKKETPLTLAISKDNIEVALALIEKITDMNLINNTTAISRNIRENVQQSREFNEKISGLFNFISNGKTALMIAISKGNTEVALKLIEKGADIDFANNKGETALMLAISKRNAEVALKIIEISKKADMGFENKNINLISAANEMLKIKDSKKADLIEKDMKKIEKIFGQKFSMIDKNKLENNVRKPPLCFAHTGVIKKDGVNNINLKRKPIQLVSSSVVQTKKHEVNNSLTVNNPNIGGKRKKL